MSPRTAKVLVVCLGAPLLLWLLLDLLQALALGLLVVGAAAAWLLLRPPHPPRRR